MAKIHPVTRLGNGQHDLFEETATAAYLSEKKDKAGRHKRDGDGIIVHRAFPEGGETDRAFEGEYAVSVGIDPSEDAEESYGNPAEKERHGYKQRLFPGKFSNESTEIKPQEQESYESAHIIEHPVSVPESLAPERA